MKICSKRICTLIDTDKNARQLLRPKEKEEAGEGVSRDIKVIGVSIWDFEH